MTARALQWGHPAGRESTASEPQSQPQLSARAGADIPGYTGYIPGKRPEMDIVGNTFATENKIIDKAERTVAGPLGKDPTPKGFNPPPRATPRAGQLMPGYTGYIPGKNPEATAFGKTFADINDHVATGPKEKPRQDQPVNKDLQKASRKVPGAGNAMVALPGYTGWVPAKMAENVIGGIYTSANNQAAKEFKEVTYKGGVSGGNPWQRTTAPETASRCGSGAGPGIRVPGYSGHVPGKHPEADNMGMTFAEANTHGNRVHKYGRGHVPKEDRDRGGDRGSRSSAAPSRSTCSGSGASGGGSRASGGGGSRASGASGASSSYASASRPGTAPAPRRSEPSLASSSRQSDVTRSMASSRRSEGTRRSAESSRASGRR